ncbi:MAG: MBL fold metallo-hydrolase [Thermoleophilia bacterium]|nr:MBL fold metallo-hydrolase [Thermoleophilia bacterium]MDQ3859855.1 MBL fold metallo-hydrolase [Actinomycetota bacterium]
MRLTVIGSSPAWPNPGSAQSGYLLEGPGTLLLDCGPGVLGRLRETERIHAVDAIAITHFHLDHWGDLVPWAWLAAFGADRPPRAEVWLPPGGVDELATFASRWGNDGMFERAFDLREFEPRVPFPAAGFTVEARPVRHYAVSAVGFRISHDGRTLAYSGDSGPASELAELAAGADLFLCEATLARGADEREPRGHLAADEAVAAASGPVLLTHRPVELPPPIGAPLAHDGLSVEI